MVGFYLTIHLPLQRDFRLTGVQALLDQAVANACQYWPPASVKVACSIVVIAEGMHRYRNNILMLGLIPLNSHGHLERGHY